MANGEIYTQRSILGIFLVPFTEQPAPQEFIDSSQSEPCHVRIVGSDSVEIKPESFRTPFTRKGRYINSEDITLNNNPFYQIRLRYRPSQRRRAA